ncbi:hypothetical protein [Flavobacterium sp. AG291]|uniref:ORC-CDC6 family AAA ATPase n=1 Tax=Flavobacterium sp. AG291 TaxID=2184000 RepID=UPI000E0A6662|nr:hypothetical protein [Flavobacterium sp. AG291]RDI07921.1 hypothetical protein DEU42_11211 [Flavobacterium sp. AG291]
MIKDLKIIQAVSSISQRAERQRDINKIVDSYVEVGILPQLINNNNQILYGRRGTGKTHILRILEDFLNKQPNKTTCYIDCRFLGSSPQFTDSSMSIDYRCSSLFTDILNEIFDSILNHIAYHPNKNSDLALESLNSLSIASVGEIQKSKKVINREKGVGEDESGTIAKISPSTISFDLSDRSKVSKEKEKTTEFQTEEFEKIIFPDLHHYLQRVLKEAETDLVLIIDEWSAIPLDIQPYLAEFFKKSFIPVPEVVVKIGALEYRSNFTIPREKHNYIGFELGSDISTNLDIDEYFVYDRNPAEITKTFAEILFKHIKSELPNNYLSENFSVNTVNQLIQTLFTGAPAFDELVRASEGVIRDFINIFTLAFFDAQRKNSINIDKKIVIESSRQWFENDKAKNLDDHLHEKIRLIIHEVIGKKKARSFLVSRELEQNPIIQKLFDARVIHIVKKGYSDKDNPGVRYNIYSLDYGTYVDLINTSKQPQLQFEIFEGENEEEFIVPFDDKRSIRRIILTKEILD